MIQKIKEYFVQSYNELKKVNWPTKQETIRLTWVVIVFSVLVAVVLGVLDIGFSYAIRYIIV